MAGRTEDEINAGIEGLRIRRFRRLTQIRKRSKEYDWWLGNDDRDVQEVRDRGIVEEKWYGSLLEQYAAFLNWFRREFEGRHWHCLAREVVRTPEEYAPLSQVNSTGQGLRRLHPQITPSEIKSKERFTLVK